MWRWEGNWPCCLHASHWLFGDWLMTVMLRDWNKLHISDVDVDKLWKYFPWLEENVGLFLNSVPGWKARGRAVCQISAWTTHFIFLLRDCFDFSKVVDLSILTSPMLGAYDNAKSMFLFCPACPTLRGEPCWGLGMLSCGCAHAAARSQPGAPCTGSRCTPSGLPWLRSSWKERTQRIWFGTLQRGSTSSLYTPKGTRRTSLRSCQGWSLSLEGPTPPCTRTGRGPSASMLGSVQWRRATSSTRTTSKVGQLVWEIALPCEAMGDISQLHSKCGYSVLWVWISDTVFPVTISLLLGNWIVSGSVFV